MRCLTDEKNFFGLGALAMQNQGAMTAAALDQTLRGSPPAPDTSRVLAAAYCRAHNGPI